MGTDLKAREVDLANVILEDGLEIYRKISEYPPRYEGYVNMLLLVGSQYEIPISTRSKALHCQKCHTAQSMWLRG